jgi:hypothetical protein
VTVVRPRQQRGELDLLQIALERPDRLVELRRELRVVRIAEQLVDREGVVEFALQGIEAIELRLQARQGRGDALTLRRVVPERRVRRLSLEVRDAVALPVDVKGTPWRRRRAPRDPATAPCDRSSHGESIGPAIVRR